MKPLNGNVIVRPDRPEEKFVGFEKPDGIFDVRPDSGTVVESDSPLVKPGQKVSYNRHKTYEIGELIIVHESDIHATYE